jgi:hypothetical protein
MTLPNDEVTDCVNNECFAFISLPFCVEETPRCGRGSVLQGSSPARARMSVSIRVMKVSKSSSD